MGSVRRSRRSGTRRFQNAALFGLLPAALLVSGSLGCRGPKPYSAATVESFMSECRGEMWAGNPGPSVDQYCRCVLNACQNEWDAERLNIILVRSRAGGWGTGLFGMGGRVQYPAAMMRMMARCKTAMEQ